MATILPPPLQIKLKSSEAANEWKRFKQSWNNYELAAGISEKEERVKVATFLHVAGPEILEKYEGFLWDQPEDKLILQKIIEKFDQDYEERTNIIAERFKFLSRKQSMTENCDQFATSLRSLVNSCGYSKPEEALRDQFVLQICDQGAREKLLDEAQKDAKGLTFVRAINLVKNYEATKMQKKRMNDMDRSDEYELKSLKVNNSRQSRKCWSCGFSHEKFKCPAYGKECNKCKKLNHYAKMCKTNIRNVKMIEEYDESEEP